MIQITIQNWLFSVVWVWIGLCGQPFKKNCWTDPI